MQHQPRFLKLVESIRPLIKEINAYDLMAKLESGEAFTLLDVREAAEYADGHLPHAIPLSKGVLERDIEQLIPHTNTPIVVYCSGGFRSALAAYSLQNMGYQHVQSLILGSRHWQELNLAWEIKDAK